MPVVQATTFAHLLTDKEWRAESAHLSSLDRVAATEQLINLLEVVSTRHNRLGAASRLVALLQMRLLPQIAKLIVHLWLDSPPGRQPRLKIDRLGQLARRSRNSQAEQRTRESRPVRENTNALALQLLGADIGQQRHETAPDGAAVHVSAHSRHLDGGLDAGAEAGLGEAHEGLLDRLVGDGGLVVDLAEGGGDVGESGGIRVGEVVVVEEAGVGLGDQLAGGRVEGHVVETVYGGLAGVLLDMAVTVGMAVSELLERGLAGVVSLVACIDGLGVAGEGEVAVDDGVLGG